MLAIGMPIPMPIAGICIGMFIIGLDMPIKTWPWTNSVIPWN